MIGSAISDRQRLAWIVVLLVLCLAAYHHWRNPVLRFSSPVVNHAAFAAAMLLPGAALVLALECRSVALRIVTSVGTALVCLPSALLFLLSLLVLGRIVSDGGVHGGFEPIQTVAVGHSVLRVYRTNGGATTAFGIVVRQEMTIAPGVCVVRDVYRAYPAHEVEVGAVTPHSAVIDGDTVRLRPLVWF